MKDRFKSLLLTGLILVIIGILLFFNYYYYKLSPVMIYDNKDQEILEIFESKNNLNNLALESRFTLEDIYYSAVDNDFIYMFLDNGDLVLKLDKNDLDYDKAENVAKSILDKEKFKVNLAIYKEEPVYVIVSKDYDIMLDFYKVEEVFRYRKGISNE